MAASVRIEDEAFSDLRYSALGDLLGTNAYDALGRMAHLWRQCTAQGRYSLPVAVVATVVDPQMLVESGLGEKIDAEIRIKGTRGRIEWLKEKRKASKKGGLATRARWEAKRRPNGLVVAPSQQGPNEGPPAPAPAPALKEYKNIVEFGKLDATRQKAKTLASEAVAYLNAKIGSKYSCEAKALQDNFRALAADGVTAEQVRAVVDAKISQWRGDEKMRHYLRATTLFRPSNFRRYMAEADGAPGPSRITDIRLPAVLTIGGEPI